MAAESKRGCGFRKVGGLYLVSMGKAIVCDRLPIELSICPCCGGGIKPARGWTWVEPKKLFGGDHVPCRCAAGAACPACFPGIIQGGRAGLLWVGEKFYGVESFMAEADNLGISRRISCLPRGLKVGHTWVFMAHRKAIQRPVEAGEKDILGEPAQVEDVAGIFTAFRPASIERVVKQSEFDCWAKWSKMTTDQIIESGETPTDIEADISNRLQKDVDRGITLVPVPDDDKDHQ